MVYLSSIELDWFPETLETPPLDPPLVSVLLEATAWGGGGTE